MQGHAARRNRPLLEYEFYRLGCACAYGDFLGPGAQFFVPRLHGIFARRQIFQFESPIFVGDREVRIFYHGNIAPHPGMNIALHGNRDLFPRKDLLDRSACGL